MKRIVMAFVGALMLCSCDAICENDDVVEMPSPDGALKAVSFRRSCGATTGFSTHVSLLSAADRLPNNGGNVLVVDNDWRLTLRWRDDHQLGISGVGAAETYKEVTVLRGVKITYEWYGIG